MKVMEKLKLETVNDVIGCALSRGRCGGDAVAG